MWKFAILRGSEILRFESTEDTQPLPPECKRMPVAFAPKPEIGPNQARLPKYDFDQARGVVIVGYQVIDEMPRPAPAATVVVEQADTSAVNTEIAALKQQLIEMQAASHLSWLCFTASNAEAAEASKARAELEPIAKARGVTVQQLIEHVSAAQAAAAAAAMAALRGA
jgi:hypothetical protein